MYNILRMDHEPEKRYDAQSEGASIFRPPPPKKSVDFSCSGLLKQGLGCSTRYHI